MSAQPKPAHLVDYPGDQRQILTDEPKGPTTYGAWLKAVTADYDPLNDKTRVGFVYVNLVSS